MACIVILIVVELAHHSGHKRRNMHLNSWEVRCFHQVLHYRHRGLLLILLRINLSANVMDKMNPQKVILWSIGICPATLSTGGKQPKGPKCNTLPNVHCPEQNTSPNHPWTPSICGNLSMNNQHRHLQWHMLPISQRILFIPLTLGAPAVTSAPLTVSYWVGRTGWWMETTEAFARCPLWEELSSSTHHLKVRLGWRGGDRAPPILPYKSWLEVQSYSWRKAPSQVHEELPYKLPGTNS